MTEPVWWSRHWLHPWEERSGNPDLPKWFRLVSLAFGRQRANQHAPFGPGDVAFILGGIDPATGEYTPDRNVSHHIQTAVRFGLLDPDSCARCLVVKCETVEGGIGGAAMARAPCPWHHRNSKLNKSVTTQRKRVKSP